MARRAGEPVRRHDHPPARSTVSHPTGDLARPRTPSSPRSCGASRPRSSGSRPGRRPRCRRRTPAAIDALARVEPEHPGRCRRARLHPPAERDLARDDALVQQVHPVLDARHPVRDLGEVAAAQFLLVLEAERAVVGGDDRQVVGPQPAPQRRPGATSPAAAAKPRTWRLRSPASPGLRWTGTGTAGTSRRRRSARSLRASATAVECLRRRKVHDVERRTGDLRPAGSPETSPRPPVPAAGSGRAAPGPRAGGERPARPAGRSRCRSRRAS